MAERWAAERFGAYARIRRNERRVQVAAAKALARLTRAAREQLAAAGWDPDVLGGGSGPDPVWSVALEEFVAPAITAAYIDAMDAAARAGVSVDATPYAARHLESVHSRLVRVPEEVFDSMRVQLRHGLLAGDTIPQIAARVDELLGDSQRWEGRATTIARTEVIGANNAGGYQAARVTATELGEDHGAVVKEWLSTGGPRTRPTHQTANGQQVLGMDTPFSVGGFPLDYPGDPAGPAKEVVKCRCTALYHLPGDAGYPAVRASATRGATMTAAVEEAPATEDAPLEEPTHAGVAVQATDTGRVLLIQRRMDQDDPPEVLGTWEFPGGGIEGTETPDAAAWREFAEETGLPTPVGEVTGGWRSPDGVYQGLLFTTPVEAEAFPAGINPAPGDRVVADPDNDNPRIPDVQAWFTLAQVQGLGAALRPAVRDNTDWSIFDGGEAVTSSAALTAATTTEEPIVTAAAPETETEPTPAQMPEEPVIPTEEEASTDLTWVGVLAPEGVRTGDRRKFREGGITWLGTPGVLKAMFEDRMGHEGSVPVGLILGVERNEAGRLLAHGTWDTGENAIEARRQNIAGILRGVSVDLDDVELSFEDADGNPLEGDAIYEVEEEPTLVVEKGRLRAATLWCMPAYVEAYVLDSTVADDIPDLTVQGAEGSTPLAMAASAATAAPTETSSAPLEAFAYPGAENLHDEQGNPRGFTTTPDGRCFGYAAVWGVCHIGIDGACVTPPKSATGYAHFLTRDYTCADGTSLAVGAITLGTGHAPLELRARPAAEHYDNTGTAGAFVMMGEDETGIWFAGALNEDLSPQRRREFVRAGGVSGDWRRMGNNLEMVATLAVNVPGFPIPKVGARVAGGQQQALVASGIVTHDPAAPAAAPVDYARLAREVSAYQVRQARHDTARRSLRSAKVARLTASIKRRS